MCWKQVDVRSSPAFVPDVGEGECVADSLAGEFLIIEVDYLGNVMELLEPA